MVGSVNKVILLGNLGRDPEIRSMQSGSKMANFSIATSKRWKDRNTQEQKEKTSWHNIVIFGDGLLDLAIYEFVTLPQHKLWNLFLHIFQRYQQGHLQI